MMFFRFSRTLLVHCVSLLAIVSLSGQCQALLANPSKVDKSIGVETVEIKLSDLGYGHSIDLQGSESDTYIGFGSRLDESVSKAQLVMRYITSPAMLEVLSHLKVYLNGELQAVVPFRKDTIGSRNEFTVDLDTRFLSDFNQLRIELIGQLDKACWNPDDPSIWAEISQSSTLRLTKTRLPLSNDLSLLPAPFFDQRDFSKVQLPIIFGANKDLGTVKAAAVAASYFGSLALWRGIEFPVFIDTLPHRHAVVFASNDSRPAFLKDLPPASGPSLQMISHPDKPEFKLLLIQGRDASELLTAVKGLAAGSPLLSGQFASIEAVHPLAPRRPYDAPNWIRTDRPVTLGELSNSPLDLQASGRLPQPINISVRLPPDLFTWQSRGIPLDLRYRYSPPSNESSDSKLNFTINDQFVESFRLGPDGAEGELNRVRVPLLNMPLFGTGDQIRIPAFRVGIRNQLSFQFAFSATADGSCRTIPAGNYRAAISQDSTVDFTGFPHYIEMPNLRAFATGAFPFSRMADLSETAILLASSPSTAEISTALNMAGFMGASTGYPGFELSLSDNWDDPILRDKDLLAIAIHSSLPQQSVDTDKQAVFLLDAARRFLQRPNRDAQEKFGDPSKADNRIPATAVEVRAEGQFAALLGSRSPLERKRSIVSLVASHPDDLRLISTAINDPGRVSKIYGSVSTFRHSDINSFRVGESYYRGKLPFSRLVWYHFSKHPFLLALMSLLLVVTLTVLLTRALSRRAAKRLEISGGRH